MPRYAARPRPALRLGTGFLVALVGFGVTAPAASAGSESPRGFTAGAETGTPPTRPLPRTAIAGGDLIAIATTPWQVHVRIGVPRGLLACGGTILDATHVVTAAHCTFEPDSGRPIPASAFTVDAGFSAFDPLAGAVPLVVEGEQPQTVGVQDLRRHPYYRGEASADPDYADDVAVLTLAAPLALSEAPGSQARALPLPSAGAGPDAGTLGYVSGYGRQTGGVMGLADGRLYRLPSVLTDASDGALSGADNAVFLVGRSPVGSFCQGDSGSALVSGAPATFAGIVSTNYATETGGCLPDEANNYTNVAAPEILDFIRGDDNPPRAPRGGQDVALSAPRNPPLVGDTLSCRAGTWSGEPAVTYRFFDAAGGLTLADGTDSTYVVGPGDLGRSVGCRATARGAGGVGHTPRTRATAPVGATPPGGPGPPPPPPPLAPPPPSPGLAPPARSRVGLSPRLSVGRSRVRPGERVSVRLRVTNTGTVPLSFVTGCVQFDHRLRVVAPGRGARATGRVCFEAGRLAAGRSRLERFTVRVARTARPGRSVLTATVRAPGTRAVRAGRTILVVGRAATR